VAEEGLSWTLLQEKNWQNSWRRFFQPQKVGKGLWVGPPWIVPPELPQRQVITIEPGMAFGTGTHPTTRTCLEFLEEVVASLNSEKLMVLDVGTGSGILAIAVAKMGARKVLALDNDPIALRAAQANIRLNRAQQKVKLTHVALGRVKGSFTVVVANLTAETIIGLAEALAGSYLTFDFLGTGFAGVFPYIVMLVVLLVRPYGLFGTAEIRRV